MKTISIMRLKHLRVRLLTVRFEDHAIPKTVQNAVFDKGSFLGLISPVQLIFKNITDADEIKDGDDGEVKKQFLSCFGYIRPKRKKSSTEIETRQREIKAVQGGKNRWESLKYAKSPDKGASEC